MKQLTITIPLIRKDEAELTPEEAGLLQKAKQATYRSYSPYSHFSVGAAALLDDGTVIEGCNQENCAYPDRAVTLLCIAARDTEGNFTPRPIPPCGGCRQVLSETEDRQKQPMRIMLYGTEGVYFVNTVKDLLPIHFDTSYL